MYALVNKNKVILGPINWNRGMFMFRLKKMGIHELIPSKPQKTPFFINEDVKILNVELIKPEINDMVQYHRGPLWTIKNDIAIANYEVIDIPINAARQNFKNLTAAERYKKESSGIKVKIQETEVSIPTNREDRNIFFQKLLLMGDEDIVNWKFPETWLTITKSELQYIVSQGINHIQNAFDWENEICNKIDSANNKEELLSIKILEENNKTIEGNNDD